MKRAIFLIVFLLFLSGVIRLVDSSCTSSSPCCCQDVPGGVKKCYNTGSCCKMGVVEDNKLIEYWDPSSCYRFDMWVEPKSMAFVIGRKTQINLYLKNTGSYTDNYTIDYIVNGNPGSIQVDMFGVSPTGSIAPEEIKTLHPRITILSTTASGNIIFNATSQGDPNRFRNVTFNVASGNLPISLYEFNFFGLIFLIFLTGIIYFFFKSNH